MWEWLLRRKKRDKSIDGDLHPDPPSRQTGSQDTGGHNTVGGLVDQMLARGYEGPYAFVSDGFLGFTFHAPETSGSSQWIEPVTSPFAFRTVNCKALCRGCYMFCLPDANGNFVPPDPTCPQPFRDKSPAHATTIDCILSYAHDGAPLPEGWIFKASQMEDLWNIYHSGGYLYFFRSWSNELRYRAKIEISQRALQVTSMQVAGQIIPNVHHLPGLNKADRWLEDDPELPLRQVDFLIKSHMFRFDAPCPLPKSVSDDTGPIGHYVLAEYGRWGGFASHEDTSLYRIQSKEMARLPDPLLPIPILQAMDRVARENSLENRSALIDGLRKCPLFLSFTFPEAELLRIREGKAVLSEDTPVIYCGAQRHRELYIFGYTDLAYRAAPSGGVIGLGVGEACDRILQNHPEASLILNPVGPVTCELSNAELVVLARQA